MGRADCVGLNARLAEAAIPSYHWPSCAPCSATAASRGRLTITHQSPATGHHHGEQAQRADVVHGPPRRQQSSECAGRQRGGVIASRRTGSMSRRSTHALARPSMPTACLGARTGMYEFPTYAQVGERMAAAHAGYASLGLLPKERITVGSLAPPRGRRRCASSGSCQAFGSCTASWPGLLPPSSLVVAVRGAV